jgi:hypothetical protein
VGQHDLSYRLFFTHHRMIHDLLREIVGEQWVERIEISDTLTLEELETMLAESIDRWNREIREEGRQEGRQEGEAWVVLRQLRLKFGPLEPEVEAQVRSAHPDRLLEWGDRVLTAKSLQEVFQH